MVSSPSSRRNREFREPETESGRRDTAIEDIAFLTASEQRVVALCALAERPRDRAALLERTGVSSSTIGRTIREFENRYWIERRGRHYEATQLGVFVAAKVDELIEQIQIERRLRDVWHQLPVEASDLGVELMLDAVVTVADATDPYSPVTRFVSLLEETDHFRFVGFDIALLEPCKDEFRQRVLDGMRAEVIDPPNLARNILAVHSTHCEASLESGNLSVRVHDDLPQYGLCLFDDRVGISGYESDSGTVLALVDTDDPEVREWAETTYESYRRESRPLDTRITH